MHSGNTSDGNSIAEVLQTTRIVENSAMGLKTLRDHPNRASPWDVQLLEVFPAQQELLC